MGAVEGFVHWVGRGFRKVGRRLTGYRTLREVWIDVGAQNCDSTYGAALANPSLKLFAFEPNLELASELFGAGALPNIFMIPMAVAETDGSAEFNVTAYSGTSSLLPLDQQAIEKWVGGQDLRVVAKRVVPTIRLDTFMRLTGIKKVDFLKIDAQGTDLAVVKSLGERLKDVRKIYLEVYVTKDPLYRGTCTKDEVMEYLGKRGFELVAAEPQSDGQEENLTFENREWK
jgi:FkbM family methyltransferase